MAVKTDGFLSGLDSYVSNAISKLSYDKTIQATITEIKGGGKYSVTNGTNVFEAMGAEGAYQIDDTVFILIPGGDFDQEKTILRKKTSDTDTITEGNSARSQIVIVSDNLTKLYQSDATRQAILTIKEKFVANAERLIDLAKNVNNLSDFVATEISTLAEESDNTNTEDATGTDETNESETTVNIDLSFSVEELYEKYISNYRSTMIPFGATAYPGATDRTDYFNQFCNKFENLISEAQSDIAAQESVEINNFNLFKEDFNSHRLNRLYFRFRPWCEAKPISKNIDDDGTEITSILMKGAYTIQLIMTTESGHRFTFEIPSSDLQGNLFPREEYASYQDVCWDIDYDALLEELEPDEFLSLVETDDGDEGPTTPTEVSFVPNKFEVNVIYGAGMTLKGQYVENIHSQYPNVAVNIDDYEIYFGFSPDNFIDNALNIWFVDEKGDALIKRSYQNSDWDADEVEPWRLQAAVYYRDPSTGQVERWVNSEQINPDKEVSLKWYISDYTAYKMANDPSGEGGWLQINDAGEDVKGKSVDELQNIVKRIAMQNSSAYKNVGEDTQALKDLIIANRELSFNYAPGRAPLYFQQSVMIRAALYIDNIFTGTYSNTIVLNNDDFEKKEFIDEQEKFHIYSYQDPYAGTYMLYKLEGSWSLNTELLNKKLALRYDNQEIDQYLISLAESNEDIFTISWEKDTNAQCTCVNKNIILEKAVTSLGDNSLLYEEEGAVSKLSNFFVVMVQEVEDSDTQEWKSLDIYVKAPATNNQLSIDEKINFISALLQEENNLVNKIFKTRYDTYLEEIKAAEDDEARQAAQNKLLNKINFKYEPFDKELLKLDFALPGNGIRGLNFETFTAKLYEGDTAITTFYTIQMGTYSTSKTGTVLTINAVKEEGNQKQRVRAIVQNENILTIEPHLWDQFGGDRIDEVTDAKWEWYSPKDEEDFIFQDADNLLYERELFEGRKKSAELKSFFIPPLLEINDDFSDDKFSLYQINSKNTDILIETNEFEISLKPETNYILNFDGDAVAYLKIKGSNGNQKIKKFQSGSVYSVGEKPEILNKIYFQLYNEENYKKQQLENYYWDYHYIAQTQGMNYKEIQFKELLEGQKNDIIVSEYTEDFNEDPLINIEGISHLWRAQKNTRTFYKKIINKNGNEYLILSPEDLPDSEDHENDRTYKVMAPFGRFGGQGLKYGNSLFTIFQNEYIEAVSYSLAQNKNEIFLNGEILDYQNAFKFDELDLDLQFDLSWSGGTTYDITLNVNQFNLRGFQIKDLDALREIPQPGIWKSSKRKAILPLVKLTHPFCRNIELKGGCSEGEKIYENDNFLIALFFLSENYNTIKTENNVWQENIYLALGLFLKGSVSQSEAISTAISDSLDSLLDLDLSLSAFYQEIPTITLNEIANPITGIISQTQFRKADNTLPDYYLLPIPFESLHKTIVKNISFEEKLNSSNSKINKAIKRNFQLNDIFNDAVENKVGNYQILSFSALYKGEKQTTYLPIGYTSVENLDLLRMSRPSELIYYYNAATNRIFSEEKEKDNLLLAAKDNKAITSIEVINQGQDDYLLNAMSEDKTFQIKNFYLYQNSFDKDGNAIDAQDPEKDWYLAAPNVYIPNNNASVKFKLKENDEDKVWIEPTFMIQNTIPSIIVSRWSGNDFGSTEDGIDYNVMSIVGHKNNDNEFTGVIIGGSVTDDIDSSLEHSAISVFQDNAQTVKITEGGEAYFKGKISADSGNLGGLELSNGKLFGSIERNNNQLKFGEYGLNTMPKDDSLFLVGGAPKTLTSDDSSWKTRISVLPQENPNFFVSSDGVMYSQQAYLFPSFIKLYNEKDRNLSYEDTNLLESKEYLWLSLGKWITIEKDMEELTRYLKNRFQNKTLADLLNDLITITNSLPSYHTDIIFSTHMENIIITRLIKILRNYYRFNSSLNIMQYKHTNDNELIFYPSVKGQRTNPKLATAVENNTTGTWMFEQAYRRTENNNIYSYPPETSSPIEMQLILQRPIDRYFNPLSDILSFCVCNDGKWQQQNTSVYDENMSEVEAYDLGAADVKDSTEKYNLFGS